jgi:hypothetical protein
MADQQRKLELSQNIADVKAAMATVPHHEKVTKEWSSSSNYGHPFDRLPLILLVILTV